MLAPARSQAAGRGGAAQLHGHAERQPARAAAAGKGRVRQLPQRTSPRAQTGLEGPQCPRLSACRRAACWAGSKLTGAGRAAGAGCLRASKGQARRSTRRVMLTLGQPAGRCAMQAQRRGGCAAARLAGHPRGWARGHTWCWKGSNRPPRPRRTRLHTCGTAPHAASSKVPQPHLPAASSAKCWPGALAPAASPFSCRAGRWHGALAPAAAPFCRSPACTCKPCTAEARCKLLATSTLTRAVRARELKNVCASRAGARSQVGLHPLRLKPVVAVPVGAVPLHGEQAVEARPACNRGGRHGSRRAACWEHNLRAAARASSAQHSHRACGQEQGGGRTHLPGRCSSQ